VVGAGWAEVIDVLRDHLVVDAADLAMVTPVPDVASALVALGDRLPG
jgi:hypothetical protein